MKGLILENCGFSATEEQQKAAEMLAQFIFARDDEAVFVLRGYAGTGKTSLVGALVRTLYQLQQGAVLMAPTGRAAKVFASHAGHAAYTIHRRIYRQKAFTGQMDDFLQGVNLRHDTLFIVDEASMISNNGYGASAFGSGCLLDDLVQYVYSGQGCRLLLVGDTAQLPPVGEDVSPALDALCLGGYGLHVTEFTLRQVVRQLSDSGILWNATYLRQQLTEGVVGAMPQLKLLGFADICSISGSELIEALEQSYYTCGQDETMVVTRSNARASAYNKGIRARVLGMDAELCSGDRVIIVKNNYHWLDPNPSSEQGSTPNSPPLGGVVGGLDGPSGQSGLAMSFIANGDAAVVRRFRRERTEHGFRFADAVLSFPDYDNQEVEATILLDTLQSDAPALGREDQERLFQRVWDDYPELTTKRERMRAVRQDEYFNALQLKYGYAVTCHKAQGGQWRHVFIDQGYITTDMLGTDYYRWLYTAITRASERVYLVNWQGSTP